MITFLLYTGCRVGEACDLDWSAVDLTTANAHIGRTKNGEARAVHLPPPVIASLCQVPVAKRAGSAFGYRNRWEVYREWRPAVAAAKIVDFSPHDCCHTWATWMRRYAALDLRGLMGTGRWRDLKSVLRYVHVDTSEESRRADLLPDIRKAKPVENPGNRKRSAKKSIA